MHQKNQMNHAPVLLQEVIEYLDPKPGQSYLDLTAGYGGHASVVLKHTNEGTAVLVDRDQMAVEYLSQRFTNPNVEIRQQDFASASHDLYRQVRQFDMILADLGVSSPHLNIASRGFAFHQEGPLDMRMDQSQELTAETIVNSFPQEQLTQILRDYGEEPKARRIASAIVEHRPFQNTSQLADLVAKQWSRSKTHPATRTFQALRIAVNDELGLLEQALPVWFDLLNPGGRIAVISFHSLEDRVVKHAFKQVAGNRYDAVLQLLTKRPVTAGNNELAINPRARSAKLRAAVKIKNKKKGRL